MSYKHTPIHRNGSAEAIGPCHVMDPFESHAFDICRPHKPETGHRKSSLHIPSARLVLTGIIVGLGGGFHFGFQIAITNPLADTLHTFLEENLEREYDIRFGKLSSQVFWSAVAGLLFLGAVLGAAVTPSIMARIGSRRAFVLNSFVMSLGLLMGALSKSVQSADMFIISRFIAGLCVGMGTTLQAVFLSEISPVYVRGFMGTLTGLSTNLGFVLASALGIPQVFGTKELWPTCFCIETMPCGVLLVFSMFFLHEGPAECLRRGDEKGARRAIDKYYTRSQQHNDTLKQLHMELNANTDKSTWKYLFTDRATRRALYLSVLLNVTVSFSGIIAVSFFGTFLLGRIGFSINDAALANALSTLAGTAGAIVSALTVDKIGRRFLIVGGLLSLVVVNIGMMSLVWLFLKYQVIWLGYCFLSVFILFTFVFSVGIGPMAWFISTELAGPSSRSRVQSISISAQYITSFLSPIIYSPLETLTGPLSFMLFIVPLTLSTVYFYCYMPETRQRSAQQIRTMLDDSEPDKDSNKPLETDT